LSNKDLDEQAFDDETTDKRKIPESLNEVSETFSRNVNCLEYFVATVTS
jgi:hypothetical protein